MPFFSTFHRKDYSALAFSGLVRVESLCALEKEWCGKCLNGVE